MIRRVFVAALAVAVCLGVTACMGAADMQAQSLSEWKAYCAAKHKQFLWKDTDNQSGIIMNSVQVEGKCVGPGERGYRAPEPPDDDQP